MVSMLHKKGLLKMSNFFDDVLDIINRYYIDDTDSTGQIVIYTGYAFDKNGNVIEWEDAEDAD